VAFLDAKLVPGIEAVMDAAGLDEVLEGATWVVTGEGRYDEQSLSGKVVSGVVARARRAGCSVAVLAGSAGLDAARGGVDVVEVVSPPDLALEDALARADELIERAAAQIAREWLSGS
jgi:glycerate kinase